MEKHKTISEAQHAIMSELKMLLKDSEAGAGKYSFDYTSAAFAAASIRPLMIKHGIVKFPVRAENKGRYGNGTGVDVDYVFRYKLVGATELVEGVTYDDVPVAGSGQVGKSGDKSIFACATTTGKYVDLFYFYLPMVDDIEVFEEIMDIMSGGSDEKEEKPKKKLKTKKGKSEPEPEPEEEEEDEEQEEISANSSGYTYDDVFEIIDTLYESSGIETVLEFTEGDSRKKLSNYVDDLKEESGYEEAEEEEEPPFDEDEEEEYEEAEEGEEEGVDLDELDYDDPDTVAAVIEEIDVFGEGEGYSVEAAIDAFGDSEQLKLFYTRILEYVSEESPEYAEEFNEAHFAHMQDRFTELGG